MLKNNLYVYGDESIELPVHVHFGKGILQNMLHRKDSIAIINANTKESLTFGEFAQQSADIALSLARIGIRKGDVVGICSEKRLEFLPTLVGIICSGATFAAADITSGRAQILHRINISKPKVMFCSPSAYERHSDTFAEAGIERLVLFDDVRPDVTSLSQLLGEPIDVKNFEPVPVKGWTDNVFILFSSGTTGMPKGIPMTHFSFILFAKTSIADESLFAGKRMLCTREWYYSYGMLHTLSVLNAGATVVYCNGESELDFIKAIHEEKVEIIQLAPSTAAQLVKTSLLDQYDISSVKYIISASTTLGPELIASLRERFPKVNRISQLYGASEAGCICNETYGIKGSKPGSVGPVTPGFVLKVVDLNTREPLGPYKRGELCYQSPAVMSGYLGVTPVDTFDDEGFFKTGDVGYYDDDGYIFIVDRIKELIKFNTYQVAPAELEAVLLQHPAVRQAGVVGAPHAEYGQAPTAFVALQPGADVTADELVAYVDTQVSFRMRLAGGVRFVPELPMVSGKLDRKTLKLLL